MSNCNQMVLAQQSTDGISAPGNPTAQRGTRNGAGFIADWLQAAIHDGNAYIVNVGAFSTPIVGGGNGTVPDLDQPEFIISVPTGTAILPFHVGFHVAVPLLATDADTSEVLLAVDTTAACVGDGTFTTEDIYNLRTNVAKNSSNCRAFSAYTADVTDPILTTELTHRFMKGDVQGTAANGMWNTDDVNYDPSRVPVIVGPAMLVGYWGGTVAHSGFAEIQWAEFPASMFS